MGNPYLSSDESLILSTHTIQIGGMSLDLMLTSRRLILIDNSVTPFQLRTIPLETIITVVAGMDVKGDPIITMTHMDPSGTGAPHPMDFIFSRQNGQERVKECNEWAATLSYHASGARDEALSAGTLPYDPVKVLQPRMSATYRIETFSPRKTVMQTSPERAEPVRSPPLWKSPADDELPAGTVTSALTEPGEMVEIVDTSVIPPGEPGEPEIPDAEEPVSLHPEISIGADENQAITNAIRIRADEVRTVTLPVIPPPPASEAIPDAVIITKEVPAAADPINTTLNEPGAEINKDVCSGDATITQSPADGERGEQTHQREEPVSPLFEISTGADENQAITNAIRIWADEVRTETVPVPVISPLPDSEATPDAVIINKEAPVAADPINTTLNESGAEINKDVCSEDATITQSPAGDDPGEPTAQKTAPVPASVSLPAIKTQKRFSPTVLIVVTVVVILAVLGGAVIGSFYLLPGSPETTPPPAGIPVVTNQPVPTLLPTPVPSTGVWVRIAYPQTFIGEVGNPELMHPVYGSGVNLYKILWSDRIVKASAQKQDNSGDTLLLEVYNNGILIKRSSTRVPMGSVEILVDPITGNPPGIGYGDIP